MEKIQELPSCAARESASSLVHIRKFLMLSIGIVLVMLLTVLKFNQNQELIADEEGIRFYYKFYRHGNGIADLYRVAEKNQSQGSDSGLSNSARHSAMAERIENIKRHDVKAIQNKQQRLSLFPPRVKALLASPVLVGSRL